MTCHKSSFSSNHSIRCFQAAQFVWLNLGNEIFAPSAILQFTGERTRTETEGKKSLATILPEKTFPYQVLHFSSLLPRWAHNLWTKSPADRKHSRRERKKELRIKETCTIEYRTTSGLFTSVPIELFTRNEIQNACRYFCALVYTLNMSYTYALKYYPVKVLM